MADNTVMSYTSLSLIAKLVLFINNSQRSHRTDISLSNFVYLSLLSGPFIAYPKVIFRLFRGFMIFPIKTGNVFASLES